MPRRYSFLIAGLFIALALIGLVWVELAWGGRNGRETQLSASAAATAMTTAAPLTTATSAAAPTSLPAAVAATDTPILSTVVLATSTPAPAPTLAAILVQPLPTGASAAAEQGEAPVATTATPARIDVAGPITLPTIQPLPVGQGRSPVRFLIPTLGLDTPVLPMGWHVVEDASGARSEWDVVDNAAGHHIDSVYPGETGNVVLSGHNNIGGAVFRSVCVIGEAGVDFGLGDEMILQDEAGRSFIYQVEGWQRFAEAGASIAQRQANARYLAPTERAQLTLITCWPPNSNTHRVVVTGVLTGMR